MPALYRQDARHDTRLLARSNAEILHVKIKSKVLVEAKPMLLHTRRMDYQALAIERINCLTFLDRIALDVHGLAMLTAFFDLPQELPLGIYPKTPFCGCADYSPQCSFIDTFEPDIQPLPSLPIFVAENQPDIARKIATIQKAIVAYAYGLVLGAIIDRAQFAPGKCRIAGYAALVHPEVADNRYDNRFSHKTSPGNPPSVLPG